MRQELEQQREDLHSKFTQLITDIINFANAQLTQPNLEEIGIERKKLQEIERGLSAKYKNLIDNIEELPRAAGQLRVAFKEFDKVYNQQHQRLQEQLAMRNTEIANQQLLAQVKKNFVTPKVEPAYLTDHELNNVYQQLTLRTRLAQQICQEYEGSVEEKTKFLKELHQQYTTNKQAFDTRYTTIRNLEHRYYSCRLELNTIEEQLQESQKALKKLGEKDTAKQLGKVIKKTQTPNKIERAQYRADFVSTLESEIAALDKIIIDLKTEHQKAMVLYTTILSEQEAKRTEVEAKLDKNLHTEVDYFDFHYDVLTNPEFEIKVPADDAVKLNLFKQEYDKILLIENKADKYKKLRKLTEKLEKLFTNLQKTGSVQDISDINDIISEMIEKRDRVITAFTSSARETLNADDLNLINSLCHDYEELKPILPFANPSVACNLRQKMQKQEEAFNEKYALFEEYEEVYRLTETDLVAYLQATNQELNPAIQQRRLAMLILVFNKQAQLNDLCHKLVEDIGIFTPRMLDSCQQIIGQQPFRVCAHAAKILAYAATNPTRQARFKDESKLKTLLHLILKNFPYEKIDIFMDQEILATRFVYSYAEYDNDHKRKECILNILQYTDLSDVFIREDQKEVAEAKDIPTPADNLLEIRLKVINNIFRDRKLTEPFVLLSILNNPTLTSILATGENLEANRILIREILQTHPYREQKVTQLDSIQFAEDQLAAQKNPTTIFLQQQNRPKLLELLETANSEYSKSLHIRANLIAKISTFINKYSGDKEVQTSVHKFLKYNAMRLILSSRLETRDDLTLLRDKLCQQAHQQFIHRDWGKRFIADIFNLVTCFFMVRLAFGYSALFSTAPTKREKSIAEFVQSEDKFNAACAA